MLLVSECTGLDPSWMHLTTTATFPLVTGTTLYVSCGTVGYMNIGDSTLTCNKNSSYIYVDEPECSPGKFSLTPTVQEESRIFGAILYPYSRPQLGLR